MSKIVNAHVQSLETTIASLKDERARIDAEIRVFEAALKVFGKPTQPVKLGKTQQIAYELLQRKQKVAVMDVAKAANISGQAAGQALYKLVGKKLAKKGGRGLFVRK